MKQKIIGIIVCILLVSSVVPAVESSKNSKITPILPTSVTQPCSVTNWTEEKKLLASDGEAGDNFGCYVSLCNDTALIGAWLDDDNGYYSGSAYVFIRIGTTWTQQAKLLASDGHPYNLFGWSVSLDNDTALIGAYWDDENGAHSGSAYVFTRTSTNWTQQAKLLASDGTTGDYFGYSVSLSGDTAIISAPLDNDNGNASGSAYVFTRTGNTWAQQAKLFAADGDVGDNFGIRVSLADETAIIGASADDDIRGSAYVFTRNDTTWTQQAKLVASDGQSDDFFGWFISLSGDTALIGAPGDSDDGDSSGSAYVFTRIGTIWTQQAKLVALDGHTGDYFGYAVSVCDDTGIVTAPQDDDKGADSGSAYVFTRIGTTWTQQKKLLASDGQEGDTFGWWSVSLNGNSALISSCRDDDNGLDSGSAYVFTNVHENQPPEIPAPPSGPSSGTERVDYTFSTMTTDPDDDTLFYLFDWGDGSNSSWVGPFSSGVTATATHAWSEIGTYLIRVKAKDENGAETGWSPDHPLSIFPVSNLTLGRFKGGLGFSAVLKNSGDNPVTNITWSIDLKGNHVGRVSSLAPGDDIKITTGLLLGFGKTKIMVTASCYQGATCTKNGTAFLLIFFVVGVSESIR
jgi:hypothetical protein